MNEYMHGPIWVYGSNGIPVRKFPLIDNDPLLSELNNQAMEKFSGYYEFDSHDVPCWFNHDKEKDDKDLMLDIIAKIIERLNNINNGSFIIEDYESDRLNNL